MRLKTNLNPGHQATSRQIGGIFQNAPRLLRMLLAGVLICLPCFLPMETSQADEPTVFKTGKALQTAMAARISWSSIGAELGDQLHDLQHRTEVIILRDRRLDPHRLISIKADSVPRIQVLQEIAAAIPDGGFCLTENFACVGPADAVFRLPILLDRNNAALNARRKKYGSVLSRKLTATVDLNWPQLAEPRQILIDRARAAGLEITNPQDIPHDVWAAGQLPKVSFVELATVILNQFDQTFVFSDDEPKITIVPIDPHESLEHRYVVGNKLKSAVAAAWKSKVPHASVAWTGSTAKTTGTLMEHTMLQRILQELEFADDPDGKTSPIVVGSIRSKNYQIKAERATIGQLIQFFRGEKVPIEVIDENDPATQATLQQIIQLDQLTESLPGEKFFPKIFGQHFKSVDVRDDRVVLSAQ